MQLNKCLVPAALAAMGCGFVGLGTASADTQLYTSNGFEPGAGYVAGLPLAPNAGAVTPVNQPAGSSDPWVNFSSNGNTAGSYVLAYGSTGTNLQYAEVIGQNLSSAGNEGALYAPSTYTTTPYNATGKSIAIRWSMAYTPSTTNPFVGVTAYDGANAIGLGGVDGSGKLAGLTTLTAAGQGFTAAVNTFYQYELLLDYTNQKFTVLEAPADNSTLFTPMGSGAFQSTTNNFTDADLSVYAATPGTNPLVSGAGLFDNYTVSVVPEPMSLSILALGLLGVSRRRQA